MLLGNLLGDTARGFESKPGAPWAERVAAGLGELLKHLAEHPDEARFAIVEVLAAGPKALARRDAALRQFTGFLDAGRAETSVELPGITSLSLAGGDQRAALQRDPARGGGAPAQPPAGPDVLDHAALPRPRGGRRGARAGAPLDARELSSAPVKPLFSVDARGLSNCQGW